MKVRALLAAFGILSITALDASALELAMVETKLVGSLAECMAFLDESEDDFVQSARTDSGATSQGLAGQYADGTVVSLGCSGNVLTIYWYTP